jgi:hypothetical protein
MVTVTDPNEPLAGRESPLVSLATMAYVPSRAGGNSGGATNP